MKSIHFLSVRDANSYFQKNVDQGFVIFSNVENVKELSLTANKNIVLCSTSGEYTPQGYKNGEITGFEYNLNEAEIVEILHPPIKSSSMLKMAYEKVENNPNAFMLLLNDGLSGMEESVITTLYFIDKDFKILGGSAGDNLKFEKTFIYIGNQLVSSVALFFNTKTKTQIIKENIYIPTDKKLLITEADTINRTVKTFDNIPASTAYAKALGIKEDQLQNYFSNHPLGKMYKNNEVFIASPMKVNPDKSITFYCQIIPNTFLYVLNPIDPIAKIKDTFKLIEFKPSSLFVINCILRSLKFQKENLWTSIDKEILKNCANTSGFISYGEQYYKNHVNQTMVILAIE